MQLRCGAWCDRIGALPQSVKHIVVNTTVPVVFPKLPLSETTFTAVDSVPFLKGALQKTGIGAGIVDKCASPLTVHLVADLSPPYFCKLAGGLKSIKCYFAFLRVCAKRYDRVFLAFASSSAMSHVAPDCQKVIFPSGAACTAAVLLSLLCNSLELHSVHILVLPNLTVGNGILMRSDHHQNSSCHCWPALLMRFYQPDH